MSLFLFSRIAGSTACDTFEPRPADRGRLSAGIVTELSENSKPLLRFYSGLALTGSLQRDFLELAPCTGSGGSCILREATASAIAELRSEYNNRK